MNQYIESVELPVIRGADLDREQPLYGTAPSAAVYYYVEATLPAMIRWNLGSAPQSQRIAWIENALAWV